MEKKNYKLKIKSELNEEPENPFFDFDFFNYDYADEEIKMNPPIEKAKLADLSITVGEISIGSCGRSLRSIKNAVTDLAKNRNIKNLLKNNYNLKILSYVE